MIVVAAKTPGSRGLTSYSSDSISRPPANAVAKPTAMPASATSPPCRTIMRATPRRRAECQADADLARALTHDVRHAAVDADHAEQQGRGRGDGEQDHGEGHSRRGAVERVLQGAHLGERQIRIDRIDRTAH